MKSVQWRGNGVWLIWLSGVALALVGWDADARHWPLWFILAAISLVGALPMSGSEPWPTIGAWLTGASAVVFVSMVALALGCHLFATVWPLWCLSLVFLLVGSRLLLDGER